MLAVRGRLDLLTGQMAVAQRELAESADLAGQADPLLAVELLDQAVSAALEAGLYDEASQAADRMADLAERSDETARFLADIAHGGVTWLRGEAEDGMALILRAVSRLEANPALAARPERQLDLASAWCDAGRPDRAWLFCNRAVELARDEGAAGRLPRALAWTAWLDGEGGRWSRALAYGSQALDLALATGQTYLACYANTILATVEAAQGRDDDCLRHAHDAEKLAGELGLRKLEVQARRTLALLDLGRGRLEEAITRYEGVRRLAADSGIAHPYYSPIPDLIEAYARVGAMDQARALLPEFLAHVPGHANPQSAARAARCRGIAAADDFDADFLEAIALHERGDVVFQHARTHLAYGERLRRAQRRRDARVQLRAAAEIFDRLDARPWAERARAELRASGETMASPGQGRRAADATGTADRPAGQRGTNQRRGRPGGVPEHPDGRVPPVQDLPQARRGLPDGARAPTRLGRNDPRLIRAASPRFTFVLRDSPDRHCGVHGRAGRAARPMVVVTARNHPGGSDAQAHRLNVRRRDDRGQRPRRHANRRQREHHHDPVSPAAQSSRRPPVPTPFCPSLPR